MTDLKGKTIEDLKKDLAENRSDVRGFRFNISGAKVKDVKEGSNKKKDIARILTELRKRELEGKNDTK